MDEEFDFQLFLTSRIKDRGLSLEKLSELSGITLKHLENINTGNFDELPASPYLRGYFIKLGEILDFDGEKAWNLFKNQNLISSSGPKDTLPTNRFAKKSNNKKIIGIIIIVAVLIVVGVRLPKIVGKPELSIIYPEKDITEVTTKLITISGILTGGDKVTINDEIIPVNQDGQWQKQIILQPGLNTVRIRANKFLGQETEMIRQVVYRESTTIEPTSSPTSTEESTF